MKRLSFIIALCLAVCGFVSADITGQMLAVAAKKKTPPFAGALDSYTTNLTGAWSVSRRLLTSYTGSLIRVRRSSDNTEQDIGYIADGSLDETALTTFCSATDGYVVTVYAQTGSANYTQATTGKQPKIVASGTVNTNEGKPALLFITGASTCLQLSSNVSAETWIVTAKLNNVGVNYAGLLTSTDHYFLIGDLTGGNIYGSSLTPYNYYVDGADVTVALTPFGFATHCFTFTHSTSYSRPWLWGSERNIPTRYFDGPGHEMVMYSDVTSYRASVEAALMSHLGL